MASTLLTKRVAESIHNDKTARVVSFTHQKPGGPNHANVYYATKKDHLGKWKSEASKEEGLRTEGILIEPYGGEFDQYCLWRKTDVIRKIKHDSYVLEPQLAKMILSGCKVHNEKYFKFVLGKEKVIKRQAKQHMLHYHKYVPHNTKDDYCPFHDFMMTFIRGNLRIEDIHYSSFVTEYSALIEIEPLLKAFNCSVLNRCNKDCTLVYRPLDNSVNLVYKMHCPERGQAPEVEFKLGEEFFFHQYILFGELLNAAENNGEKKIKEKLKRKVMGLLDE